MAVCDLEVAVQNPASGAPCRGSDAFGITLNDQLPLGSVGKANDINNIYFIYEHATLSANGMIGGQQLVGWIAVTQNNMFVISNGRDGNLVHNIAANVPGLGNVWNAVANTTAGAISPPLSPTQANALFAMYPMFGKTGNGSAPCFTGPLPQSQWA